MRHLVCMLAATIALAGCGLMGSTVSNAGFSCEAVPSGACDEQMAKVTVGLANVRDVAIVCGAAAPCTRARGAGTAEIRLANGQTVTRAWTYVGDPVPPPAPVCVGVEASLCASYVGSEVDNVSPSKRIVAIKATCTSGSCVPAAGEMKVEITLGDGSVVTTSTGWSGGG